MTKIHFVLSVLALTCTACSTVYEGKYARDEGWRRGTVVEVASADQLTQAGWRDCRKGLSEDALAVGWFATVEFFGSHRKSTITVPVQKDAHFTVGEHVYVDIANCNGGIAPRRED